MSAQPKLLNLNASIARDQRTLIWLQNQSKKVNWSRWDAIVTFADYEKWSTATAKIVGLIHIEPVENIIEFVDRLFLLSKAVPLILLPQHILSLKSEEFWAENFDNLMNIDTLCDQYPFLTVGKDELNKWDGTIQDVIAMFTLICRYNRLMDCTSLRNDRMEQLSNYITMESNNVPNETWIITQFYQHSSKERFNEIKECLRRNCECPYVDRIVLLNERDYSAEWNKMPRSHKIKQAVIKKRLTYANFLQYVHDHVPENVYVILANADIYFGDSLGDLHKLNMAGKMLALLRWDDDGRGPEKATLFGPRADSQDTWIVLSNSIRTPTWNYASFDFELGQPGCDNAFAGHMLRQRFLLSNPALTFKTYHLHNSNIRNYTKKDTIRADIYVNIIPTYLIDTKQEKVPIGNVEHLCNELVSFEIRSSSMSNEITYCTMLEKEGRYKWEPSVENHYFEPAIPMYHWSNIAVTPTGLVYDLYKIYTGKHDEDPRFNYWSSSNVDIFTPLQQRSNMLVIPLENTDVFKHPDVYITYYLSRVLRLQEVVKEAPYWLPKRFQPYMPLGVSSDTIDFDENTACYVQHANGFLPGPANSELGREDITLLRKMYNWITYPSKKICTIILDDVLSESVAANALFPLLLLRSKGWTLRFAVESDYGKYDAFFGSSLCIMCSTSKHGAKVWALPKECCLIEFQQELAISGTTQHLAHVSDLKSWVLLLSKGSVKDVQEQIVLQFEKWLKKNIVEIVTA